MTDALGRRLAKRDGDGDGGVATLRLQGRTPEQVVGNSPPASD